MDNIHLKNIQWILFGTNYSKSIDTKSWLIFQSNDKFLKIYSINCRKIQSWYKILIDISVNTQLVKRARFLRYIYIKITLKHDFCLNRQKNCFQIFLKGNILKKTSYAKIEKILFKNFVYLTIFLAIGCVSPSDI